MTHASLCKKTYENTSWLQILKGCYTRFAALGALLFIASARILSAQSTISPTTIPNTTVGFSYEVQLTMTNVAPNFTVSWGIVSGSLPPGLALNTASQGATTTISGTPTAAGVYSFEVEAEYNASAPTIANQTYTITVASACVPVISPASPLPQADVGVSYLVTFTASVCPGPYTYSVQEAPGSPQYLPPGLRLSANGNLSGTPTTAGTYSFVITATGANQATAQSQYGMTINPKPTITTTSPLPNGLEGVLYSQQIAATGGIPPYTFSMNANPPGIRISNSGVLGGTPTQAGTFNFNIGVTDSLGAQTVSPFQVTFNPAVSQLQVSPLSLTFNAEANGNHPPNQAISVIPASAATLPATFTLVVDNGQTGGAAPAWINVFPLNGTAPASIVVNANPGTLAAGSYTARIQVVDSNGLPTDVAVTFNVSSSPQQLTVAPATLNFAARSAAPGSQVGNLVVTSNGSTPLAFTTSVVGKSPWITSVTAGSSTVSNLPVFVQVTVNTTGLAEGAYNDAILVSSSAGNTQLPVSLFVAASGSILGLDTTGVLFDAIEGGGSTSTRTVQIFDLGDPSSTVNWTASLGSGSNWLSLAPSTGTATGTTPGVLTLSLAPNATQLTPGPYYAIVQITDPNSKNSPQYLSAVLNLQASSSAAAPDLVPAGLFFTAVAGGSAPAAQQVQVNTSSATTVTFDAATTALGNGKWLTVTPTSGSASGQTAGTISVSAAPSTMPAGVYTGNVNVSIGALQESVNVTFVVQPGSSSSAAVTPLGSGSKPEASGLKPRASGCTPSKLAITETGLVNNFSVPAGWPATLIVQLNDDCANLVTNGSVVASFSNGDAPLNLVGDSLGNYSATWQPSAVNANMVVTLNATAGTLEPATARLYGGIATNQTPPPTLSPGGVVNNLNPAAGALAPGTIAAVYGSGLGSTPVSASLPLRTTLNNTFALVGSTQAPLYYLSSSQINLQIPNEATATQQLPIVVSVNNALTLPLMLNIVPTAPGVAAFANGTIIAQHSADYSLVTSSSPAKPGEYLIMYLVGMGATNPPVASGAVSPSTTLAEVTAEPTVTVDSLTATVSFAGLTPGSVGLYQIDFQVPSSAPSGNLNVVVTQNGVAANTTVLPVGN